MAKAVTASGQMTKLVAEIEAAAKALDLATQARIVRSGDLSGLTRKELEAERDAFAELFKRAFATAKQLHTVEIRVTVLAQRCSAESAAAVRRLQESKPQ